MRLPIARCVHLLLSLAACLLAAAPALANTEGCPAGQASWIDDKRTNCKQWACCARPGVNVAWSGACTGGFAEGSGVQQWFEGGEAVGRYEGSMRAGKAEGRGIETFASGERYEGEFRNNLRNGRGVLFFADGGRYEGEFRDGKPNGRGIYTWANDGRRHRRNHDARGTDNVAVWYESEFVDGEFHGNGVMLFSEGDWYKGEWRNGRPNGHGTMQFVDGHTYTGTWRDGCIRQGKYMAWFDATEAECETRLSQ